MDDKMTEEESGVPATVLEWQVPRERIPSEVFDFINAQLIHSLTDGRASVDYMNALRQAAELVHRRGVVYNTSLTAIMEAYREMGWIVEEVDGHTKAWAFSIPEHHQQ